MILRSANFLKKSAVKGQTVSDVVVGLDISIRGTAMGIFDQANRKLLSSFYFKQVIKGYKLYKNHRPFGEINIAGPFLKSPFVRGREVALAIADILTKVDFKLKRCVIEGYSMYSRNSQVYSIAEFAGCIKSQLLSIFGPENIKEIPPAVLKKKATGHGTASKDQMMTALRHRFNIDSHDNHDIADAILLSILF